MKWWLKAGIQAALSVIPGWIGINYQLQKQARQRLSGWRGFAAARAAGLACTVRSADNSNRRGRNRVVELGTGWIPLAPFCFHLLGYREIHAFDYLPHLKDSTVRQMLHGINDSADAVAAALGVASTAVKERVSRALRCDDLQSMLDVMGIHYHAPADAASTGLAASSVDVFYSFNVMEHIPAAVITGLLKEAGRILGSDGVFYAKIGLHDHFVNADRSISRVNCLQFSDRVWRVIGQNRIMYHNRLRETDYLLLFADSALVPVQYERAIDKKDMDCFASMRLAERFKGYSKEDLAVHWIEVIGRFEVAG